MLDNRLLLNNSFIREFLQIMGFTRPLIHAFINEAIDRRLNFYDDFTDGYRMMVDRNPMGLIPDLDELANFNPIEVVHEAPREYAEVAGIAVVENNSVGPVHEGRNDEAEVPGMAIVGENQVGPVQERRNDEAEVPGMAIVGENQVGPVHDGRNDDTDVPGMAIVGENQVGSVQERRNDEAEVPGMAIVGENQVGHVHDERNDDTEVPGMAIVGDNSIGPVHDGRNDDTEVPGMAIVGDNSIGPVHDGRNDDTEVPGMAIVGENSVGPVHEIRYDNAEAAGIATPVPVALIAHDQKALVDNDELFYVGEFELLDEPYENDYIHDSAHLQVFDDDEAKRDLDLCSVCHLNAKKMLSFLVGTIAYATNEKYRVENCHRANYIIHCIICRAPSQSISRIHGSTTVTTSVKSQNLTLFD
ncbi:Protein of unknown function [Cotesia congregata]|uniref:Uncharacterized protein n=1 Tax=Cotesia congregata TaxID=51543 RepID=A0A8J2H6T3_COTCN|nr:Protein of unknown function [Cotesia congregata]